MVQPTFSSAGTPSWLEFEGVIEAIRRDWPKQQENLQRNLGHELVEELRLVASPHSVTGTYLNSIESTMHAQGAASWVSIDLTPRGGSGADRLGIYWRVLETGAKAIPKVPVKKIMAWAQMKFGSAAAGFQIAKSIRRRGIKPNPILASIFLLNESLVPIGLTPRAMTILNNEIERFRQGITNTIRTEKYRTKGGRLAARGRSTTTGRFIKL